jgi:hypothetical protein
MEQLHDVTAVEVVADFRLRLSFDDGTVGEVDFTDRPWSGVLEPLADPAYFARVHVDTRSRHDHLAERRRPGSRAAVRGSQAQPSRPVPSTG